MQDLKPHAGVEIPEAQVIERGSDLGSILGQTTRVEILETEVCSAWWSCLQDVVVRNEHGKLLVAKHPVSGSGYSFDIHTADGEIIAKLVYNSTGWGQQREWQVLSANEDLIGTVNKGPSAGICGAGPTFWTFRDGATGNELQRMHIQLDDGDCGSTGPTSIVSGTSGQQIGQVRRIFTGLARTDHYSLETNNQLATSDDKLMAVTMTLIAIGVHQNDSY